MPVKIDYQEVIDGLKDHADERNEFWSEMEKEFPISKFLSYSELDIREKVAQIPFKIREYTDLLNREQDILDKIQEQRDRVIGEIYDHYRFNYNERLDKSEIERYYIPKDPSLLAFNKLVRRQRWRVDYFSSCVKGLEKMAWGVKDFLKTT